MSSSGMVPRLFKPFDNIVRADNLILIIRRCWFILKCQCGGMESRWPHRSQWYALRRCRLLPFSRANHTFCVFSPHLSFYSMPRIILHCLILLCTPHMTEYGNCVHRQLASSVVVSSHRSRHGDLNLPLHRCDLCDKRLLCRCTAGEYICDKNPDILEQNNDNDFFSFFFRLQLAQMLGAALSPGNPQANMYFTLYGSNTVDQARRLTEDLKLGRESLRLFLHSFTFFSLASCSFLVLSSSHSLRTDCSFYPR